MEEKERLDIAIGILDDTGNVIERIKNQHKFEKDLNEFLNTNAYSKNKYWVVGMLNQVSEYCKDKIDTLMENQHLKKENETLKEKISMQLQLNADNVNFMENQRREIEQLKQSQNQLAIEELEKLKDFIDHNIEIENDIGALKLQEFYGNQIKKFKGW